jgi:hypothetical protein
MCVSITQTGIRSCRLTTLSLFPSRIAKVDESVSEHVRKLLPATVTFGFQYILGGDTVVIR